MRNLWKKPMSNKMLALALASAFAFTGAWGFPVSAAEEEAIVIAKPESWQQGDTTIRVSLNESALGEGITISKLEAKAGADGDWEDITESRAISISQNTTIYVRATDSEGNVYEQNRSIQCYDSEKPTLTASLTDGVLTIQGADNVSGIRSITVNGTEYTDLNNGLLKIQLTQNDFTTKKIEITATDTAGNVSDTYSLQNPYYEWAVNQASTLSSGAGTTTTSTTSSSGTSQGTTSPLPQSATASSSTSATGTVTSQTSSNVTQALSQSGETVQSVSSGTTQEGKEFYTITTKSGKTFYLIVDKEKSQDNVYFLTEVDEQDLMNFTLSDTVTLPSEDTVYATVEETKKEETDESAEETKEETVQEVEEKTEQKESSNIGSYLLITLLAAGAGVGAWYMKIYKPKHEYDDEEEYEGEAETEEPYENEDDTRKEVLEDEENENE